MSYRAQLNRPAALELQPFCDRLSLLVWEGMPPAKLRRLRVRVNGSNVKPPLTHVSLRLAKDRHRIVFALGSVPKGPSPTLEVVDPDGGVLARSVTPAIHSRYADEVDLPALVAGLAGAERARLARFLMEVCGPLFRVSADPSFISAVRALLLEITAGSGRLTARCAFLGKYLLCEAAVPVALGERLSAVCITAGALRRVALPPGILGTPGNRPELGSLGLVLEAPTQGSAGEVIVFGDGGLVCRTLAGASRRLPDAMEWLTQQGESRPQHRHYLLECLAKLGSTDSQALSLLRVLRLLTPGFRTSSVAQACLRASADLILACRDGLFVAGRLSDPHCLVDALIIERDGAVRTIPRQDLALINPPASSAALAAEETFVCFAPESEPFTAATNAPLRLSIGLCSGARLAFADGPSLLTPDEACKAVLTFISTGRSARETAFAYAEAAIRGLMREWLAPGARFDVIDVGSPLAHPSASVLVPFDEVSDIVRCRMGTFALDPAMANVEIVYFVQSAHCRVAERLLGDLQSAYGLSSRLIVPDRALPDGALLDAALRSARGPFVALLGPDVVPEQPGWLLKLVSFLKGHPQRGIVGGQILYPDHSLASAGLYIGEDAAGRWTLMPRLGGFPRDYAAAAIPTRTAALSADCLVMSRALLQQIGGPADDYLLRQSACADLCLRARQLGREVVRLPDPALFCLEHVSEAGEAHHAAYAEMDRRNLERRWRERLDSNRVTFGQPKLHAVAATEGQIPAKRAA